VHIAELVAQKASTSLLGLLDVEELAMVSEHVM